MIYGVPQLGHTKSGRVKVLKLEAECFADERLLTFLVRNFERETGYTLTITDQDGATDLYYKPDFGGSDE